MPHRPNPPDARPRAPRVPADKGRAARVRGGSPATRATGVDVRGPSRAASAGAAHRSASGREGKDRGPRLVGRWFFTTRSGAERDLVAELQQSVGEQGVIIPAPGCVQAPGAPTTAGGLIDLTFARQGFQVHADLTGDPDSLASALFAAVIGLARLQRSPPPPWSLSVWTPDTDSTQSLAARATSLERTVLARVELEAPELAARCRPWSAQSKGGGLLLQAAMLAPERVVFGAVEAARALSFAPGGRFRMHVARERPSRSARKLEEALAWLGVEPAAGEVCVDLGAAPGGWTWALLERRARVIAVDPGSLRSDLLDRRGLDYRRANAFQFTPAEPADWLFCDMAWRPREVASLLARWGRRRWAALLVANLKLPMKRKAEMVAELRAILAEGGWRDVRSRQLYHDRDEVTFTAHR